MVKRNFQRNLVISVIGATIIGISILYFPQLQQIQIQPNEIFATIPKDTLPELSITGFVREDIKCYIKTALIAEYTNGRKAEVSRSSFVGGDVGVAPVALELVDRNTQEVVKNLIVEGRVRCDMANVVQDGNPTSTKTTMYGWTLYPSVVTLVPETDNLDGRTIQLNQMQKTTSQIGLRDNEEFTFVTFIIPASQIDAVYSQYTQEYKTEFRTDLVGDLKFAFNTYPQQQYQIKFSNQQLHNSFFYNVKKIAPVTVPITFANKLIEIRSIERVADGLRLDNSINKFDTSDNQRRQIKVTGVVTTWDQSQGNPNIKITFGGSTIVDGRMTFDHTEIDNQNGVFIFYVIFNQNSAEGQYNVLMTMTGRTLVSTRTIIVDNTEPPVNTDADKDGVLDANDKCPNLVGVAQYLGCPAPTVVTPPPKNETTTTQLSDQELRAKLLEGKIINLATVIYIDGTKSSFIAEGGGFLSGGTVTTLPTLEVTTNIAGQKKVIDRIEYEVLYMYSNIADGTATSLIGSNIIFTPTVVVSSVQQGTGISVEQTGATLGIGGALQRDGQVSGYGFSLGKGIIKSVNIEAITKPIITEGQARDIKELKIIASGDFTLKRQIQEKLILKDTFVSFTEFTVNNEVNPVGEPDNCPSGTTKTFDGFGKFLSCKPVTETTKTCITPERTIQCDQSYIDSFCEAGNVNQCREQDKDGDMIPDYRDDCKNDREDNVGSTTKEQTDGCPVGMVIVDGHTPPCSEIVNGVCIPTPPPPPRGGGTVCYSAGSDPCKPQIDTFTILLVGGIAFVVIAVVILVARRR